MNRMMFDLREESAIFTILCYMIRNNEAMTDTELAIYHKFLASGWEDHINAKRDLMQELINA
ncbi:hypothetical protein IODZLFCR_CDS0009 [Salmonella phage vB_SalP_SE29]|uniref:Uncharacterized protein n=2 Tax=Molineuxvirinae TaxID=2731650 RepID=A0A977XRW2_9CAUD|nr:hypothetical protein [Salmonella phage PST_H2]